MQIIEETLALRQPPFEFEGHQGAAAFHLLLRDGVLRVRGQKGVGDPFDGGVCFESLRDVQGVLAMAIHAYGQGFEAFRQHPGIERRERRTGMAAKEPNLFDQFGTSGDDAAQHAALSVDELGGRVYDQIGPVAGGLL